MAKKIFNLIIFISIAIFIALPEAYAQQTIINVPSSDVLPTGDIILKTSTRFRPFEPDGYTAITPTVIMGLGHGMDLSIGAGTTLDKDFNTSVKGNFGLKKVFFMGSSTRFTVGGSINPSFMNSTTPDTFAYAHVTQRIKKSKTSITAGAYLNGDKHFLNTSGVILGVDQVIVPNKLRLALDWLSGEQSCGRLGVGLKYRPIPTLSITSAVIIPNKDSDRISFNVSVSKFISIDDENPIKRRLKNEKEDNSL